MLLHLHPEWIWTMNSMVQWKLNFHSDLCHMTFVDLLVLFRCLKDCFDYICVRFETTAVWLLAWLMHSLILTFHLLTIKYSVRFETTRLVQHMYIMNPWLIFCLLPVIFFTKPICFSKCAEWQFDHECIHTNNYEQ